MNVVWGLVLVVLGSLAWVGQALSWIAPVKAAAWGLTEPEGSVEPAFHADGRGEAAWDALILWTLPLAGILLIADTKAWGYFGLVGGGIYLYFGGRGVFARMAMLRRGLRIGEHVSAALAFLAVWAVVGLVTIIASASAL